ncbi:glycosyltransferase family 90 [Trichoderma arundinaceum]|uniref:Glycosyltransferase family 90 n=1 Tax=Trichoderma arundinaceum TaxID=490622 RepID=A0A395NAC5_TRIAR|nr:glycosyltransferase family 90 [Trichoderma arundinaceum]
MKFYSVIFAAAALFSAAEACKCWARGRHVSEYTHACCTYTGGIFSRDNCDGDIFDQLGKFARCCENLGSHTDCDCPTCPQEDERRKAMGLAPMTDVERVAFAAKSEKMEERQFIA